MKDSLGASRAFFKGQTWSLNCRCHLRAQEEPHWGLKVPKPVRQMSLVSSGSSESPLPGELCMFCMAHLPVFSPLCILSPGTSQSKQKQGNVSRSDPCTFTCGYFQIGCIERNRSDSRKRWQFNSYFITLIQFEWRTFNMPQRKLRKVSTGLQGKAQWGK